MSVLLTELISDAIKENDLEALSMLSPCRAINQPNAEGDRPIIQCIKQNRREAFKLLLDKGAYLQDEDGTSRPIFMLAAEGKIEWIADDIDRWRMKSHHLTIAFKRGKAPVYDLPLWLNVIE